MNSRRRQIGGLLAPEDAVDVACRASTLIHLVGPIGDQATDRRINTARIDRR
jgi:hypothetical protein